MQSQTVKDGYGFEAADKAGAHGASGDDGVVGPLYVTAADSAEAKQREIRRREKELISIAAKHLIAPNETLSQRRKYHQNDNLGTTEHVLACIFTVERKVYCNVTLL